MKRQLQGSIHRYYPCSTNILTSIYGSYQRYCGIECAQRPLGKSTRRKQVGNTFWFMIVLKNEFAGANDEYVRMV